MGVLISGSIVRIFLIICRWRRSLMIRFYVFMVDYRRIYKIWMISGRWIENRKSPTQAPCVTSCGQTLMKFRAGWLAPEEPDTFSGKTPYNSSIEQITYHSFAGPINSSWKDTKRSSQKNQSPYGRHPTTVIAVEMQRLFCKSMNIALSTIKYLRLLNKSPNLP